MLSERTSPSSTSFSASFQKSEKQPTDLNVGITKPNMFMTRLSISGRPCSFSYGAICLRSSSKDSRSMWGPAVCSWPDITIGMRFITMQTSDMSQPSSSAKALAGNLNSSPSPMASKAERMSGAKGMGTSYIRQPRSKA